MVPSHFEDQYEIVEFLVADGVGEKLVFTPAELMNQLQGHAHDP
jgi:hypothetical protein